MAFRGTIRIALFACALPVTAGGGSLAGPIEATIEKVIDSDTFRARAAIWIDQEIIDAVRLSGADAPEFRRPSCPQEKSRAIAARDFTIRFLADGRVRLSDIRHDKYAGRVAARVENSSRKDLSSALIKAGLASRDGNSDWCATSS